MDLKGIGGSGAGSALDKFQAIRDLAKKKIDGTDNRSRLTELLKNKQSELGIERGVVEKRPVAGATLQNATNILPPAPSLAGPASYGKAGAMDKPDPKPKLGRFIDFMA
jgi:hypothetical protein